MKTSLILAALSLALCGCKSKDSAASNSAKAKIYELDDVSNELKAAGVQLGTLRPDVRTFFKDHPAYQVCQDAGYLLVARMRNSKIDPKAHDEYIVVAYDKDDKVSNLEIGPPEFSVANLPSYCH